MDNKFNINRLTALPVHIPSGRFSPGSACRTQGSSTVQWSERHRQRESAGLQQHHHLSDAASHSTSHELQTVQQPTYFNFRVEGVACELKANLVIALQDKHNGSALCATIFSCIYVQFKNQQQYLTMCTVKKKFTIKFSSFKKGSENKSLAISQNRELTYSNKNYTNCCRLLFCHLANWFIDISAQECSGGRAVMYPIAGLTCDKCRDHILLVYIINILLYIARPLK